MVHSVSSSTPVGYSFTKTTTYVDENGNPIARETVRTGAPVTVYYSNDGTGMTATRVVVHRITTTAPAPTPVNADATTTTVKRTTTTTTENP